MNGISRPHPAQVPTLTEIIDVQGQASAQPSVNPPASAPPAVAPAKPWTAASPVASARPPVPLDALPVLGEVVTSSAAEPLPQAQPRPTTQPASAPPPPDAPTAVSEAQLAHRVLSDVQKQIDSMLEFRLKEAMAPLLARHTEAIARDLRDELNRTLKDVVARSVAQELAKLRQR
ncbi:hypothetical protein [Aquabacterium parvum]|uniref:hypothetical protein n=1 Tax=Aquabacterium parvum TaxID=70584 RepID=UPI000718E41F|nr:hypothetical protein [Aquabacterium parvum]MBU0916794.1 hypothetical protein [Gammaproteobacteria bacterium]